MTGVTGLRGPSPVLEARIRSVSGAGSTISGGLIRGRAGGETKSAVAGRRQWRTGSADHLAAIHGTRYTQSVRVWRSEEVR